MGAGSSRPAKGVAPNEDVSADSTSGGILTGAYVDVEARFDWGKTLRSAHGGTAAVRVITDKRTYSHAYACKSYLKSRLRPSDHARLRQLVQACGAGTAG